MLLINRLTHGDVSFGEQVSGRLIGRSTSPSCYFYAPEVDGMIDNFFIANGLKRQYPCNKRDPVVNSEKNWLETQPVDATLIESFFSELAEYNNKHSVPLTRAKAKAEKYCYSTFRTQVPGKFDVMAYLLRNRDALVAEIDPYQHYVLYGYAEGRLFDWGLFPHHTDFWTIPLTPVLTVGTCFSVIQKTNDVSQYSLLRKISPLLIRPRFSPE